MGDDETTTLKFEFPTHIISGSSAEEQVKDTLYVFNYTPIYTLDKKTNESKISGRKWVQIPTKDIQIYEDLFELKNNYILLTLPEVEEKVIPDIGDTIIIYLMKNFFTEITNLKNTEYNYCFECITENVKSDSFFPVILVVENAEYTVTQQGKVKEGCIIRLGKGYEYFYLDNDKEKKFMWWTTKDDDVPDNVEYLVNKFNEVLTKNFSYLYIFNNKSYKDIIVHRSEKFNEIRDTTIYDFFEYLHFTKPNNVTTYFIFSILGYKWVTLEELTTYTDQDIKNKKVLEFNDYIAPENKITRKYFSKNVVFSSFTKTISFNGAKVDTLNIESIRKIELNENDGYDILWDYLKECFLSDTMEIKIEESNICILRVGDRIKIKNKRMEQNKEIDPYDGYIVIKSISSIDTKGYKTRECVLSRMELSKK